MKFYQTIIIAFLAFVLTGAVLIARLPEEDPLSGSWKGAVQIDKVKGLLPVRVIFKKVDDKYVGVIVAHFDTQGYSTNLSDVRIEKKKVLFNVGVMVNEAAEPFTVYVKLKFEEADMLVGKWVADEFGFKGAVWLKREHNSMVEYVAFNHRTEVRFLVLPQEI